jgi:hypothetical protein
MRHYFPHIPTQDYRHGDITAAFDAALAAYDAAQKGVNVDKYPRDGTGSFNNNEGIGF